MLALPLSLWPIVNYFSYMEEVRNEVHSSALRYPVVAEAFVEESILSCTEFTQHIYQNPVDHKYGFISGSQFPSGDL